jgi:probable HAF family extracellular repeat protein
MIRRLIPSLALFLLLSGAARAEYIITDLSSFRATFTGLNDAGQLVGSTLSNANTNGHAVLYSGGTLTDLGTLPGTVLSFGFGINASGQVVGAALPGYSAINARSFLYSAGTMTELTGPNVYTISALAINASGQIAGNVGTTGGFQGFLYSGGKLTPLGSLPGGQSVSWATAINDAGQVVGASYTNNSTVTHAFLYSNGKMTDLGTLPGGPYIHSFAYAINASGQVVGQSDNHAFLYSGGKMTGLPLPDGPYSTATAINNAGQVVGAFSMPYSAHAYLFSNGKVTDLNSVLPANSGWLLQYASAINNKGQILAGGIGPGGQAVHVLLTPVAEVPEPGSLALLSVGAVGLAAHAWRKRRRAAVTS